MGHDSCRLASGRIRLWAARSLWGTIRLRPAGRGLRPALRLWPACLSLCLGCTGEKNKTLCWFCCGLLFFRARPWTTLYGSISAANRLCSLHPAAHQAWSCKAQIRSWHQAARCAKSSCLRVLACAWQASSPAGGVFGGVQASGSGFSAFASAQPGFGGFASAQPAGQHTKKAASHDPEPLVPNLLESWSLDIVYLVMHGCM